MKKIHLYLLCSLVFASCSKRNLTYLNNLPEQAVYIEKIEAAMTLHIKPDDLLRITVHSLNPEANSLFNRGVIPTDLAKEDLDQSTNPQIQGYLVNSEGYIDFPVLGKIKVGGMSKEAAKIQLVNKLNKYLKDPTVNIRFLNYQVTVIGEVNRPSVLDIQSEKINIFEALGMAGDLTPFGRRENVLVIREERGQRIMARLNLNDKEVLNSNFFHLQQNDVIYVEPTNVRAAQASLTRSNISIGLSIASILAIILTRIL